LPVLSKINLFKSQDVDLRLDECIYKRDKIKIEERENSKRKANL